MTLHTRESAVGTHHRKDTSVARMRAFARCLRCEAPADIAVKDEPLCLAHGLEQFIGALRGLPNIHRVKP